MEERVEGCGPPGRQIPLAQGRELTGSRPFGEGEAGWAALPRKASNEVKCARTKTDTGRRGENPKVRGKTLVKELGKMYP